MKKNVRWAMKHRDVLGAGAAKRRQLSDPDDVFDAVMAEGSRGTLHSGSGEIVKSRAQQLAIALSEKRKAQARKRR